MNDTSNASPFAPVSATRSLNAAVADRLAAACPALPLQHVVDRFTEAEIKKRADALYKAVEGCDQLYRQLTKVNRPDNIAFDALRNVVGESYSKSRLDEIEKLKKKIDTVERAVAKATADKPDYADLYSLKFNDDGANSNAGPAAS